MTQIKLGIIGAGMWGNVHIETIRDDGRAEITWVCDVSDAALEKAQQTGNIENGTRDYHDVLNAPDVDAVIITTPPFAHAEMAVATLRAGKHLLLEKPMAISEEEIDRVLDEAARHPDLVILEGSCRHARLNPKYRYIKSLIQSGKLGEIYHISHRHLGQGTFIEYNPNALWSMNKALAGGGPLIDWGEYDLSFHLGILDDEPELVKVREAFMIGDLRDLGVQAPVVDVEMHGYALLEFDNGMTYAYERGAGVHNESRNETRIYGTEGGLHFYYTAWEPNAVEYYYAGDEPHKEELVVDMSAHPEHDDIPFIAHFIDCLEGHVTPMMPVTLAAKHLRILLRILDAA
jgi:predicted dehydrogenase